MYEEQNVSNFDNNNEIKKLNFSVTHRPLIRPLVEKISKKFDPYQYFKNEFIQTHQKNKAEEEIEKVFYFYNFSFFKLHYIILGMPN